MYLKIIKVPKYIFEEDRLREQQKEFKLLENTKKKKKKEDDEILKDSLKCMSIKKYRY